VQKYPLFLFILKPPLCIFCFLFFVFLTRFHLYKKLGEIEQRITTHMQWQLNNSVSGLLEEFKSIRDIFTKNPLNNLNNHSNLNNPNTTNYPTNLNNPTNPNSPNNPNNPNTPNNPSNPSNPSNSSYHNSNIPSNPLPPIYSTNPVTNNNTFQSIANLVTPQSNSNTNSNINSIITANTNLSAPKPADTFQKITSTPSATNLLAPQPISPSNVTLIRMASNPFIPPFTPSSSSSTESHQ
jgi:hypothetical protein